MKYDVMIAGGGIAGLTAAAFLAKAGRRVLVCEKEARLGGLVGSFETDGLTFDAGIRAMENSGVLFPMLKSLGLDVAFLPNEVSIGIGDTVVRLTAENGLRDYRELLETYFPDDAADIGKLIAAVRRTMAYMEVLYGIDNPLFMNLKDYQYVLKTLLPWAFRYMVKVSRIQRLNMPVEEYLRGILGNPALRDIVAQHFFRGTPAFFALSYLSLYLDYSYPKGGTGALIQALEAYILKNGGEIKTGVKIRSINPAAQTAADTNGNEYAYQTLVWAADMKALYASLEGLGSLPPAVQRAVGERKADLAGKTGGDSVLTLYLTADLAPSYFQAIHSPHFFYTPETAGLGALTKELIQNPDGAYTADKDRLLRWVRDFLRLTTYEISIPALRDASLAPPGKTGLIISTLMDYPLVKHIEQQGLYDDFKSLCADAMREALEASVYPALKGKTIDGFVSTPLTIARRTGNTDGAITGWAFTNPSIPAVSKMTQIAKSVRTPVPHVLQAGQWTYSPSGFPISILTGKMAADAALKDLR